MFTLEGRITGTVWRSLLKDYVSNSVTILKKLTFILTSDIHFLKNKQGSRPIISYYIWRQIL